MHVLETTENDVHEEGSFVDFIKEYSGNIMNLHSFRVAFPFDQNIEKRTLTSEYQLGSLIFA